MFRYVQKQKSFSKTALEEYYQVMFFRTSPLQLEIT